LSFRFFSSSFAALCSEGEPVTLSNISVVSSLASLSSESIFKNEFTLKKN
jgi:hypothetical protein